eukprot:TRINITY_DN6554_c0_g1_i1.p1 TRINITY_DN6554_c0_g1~~TRINITY_DN6554_c0_g1_i1.p1  ORF type:complete len:106 (-),score=16.29 TRINITY_DN6554_c0_g1_i1:41-358(-)
MFGKNLNSTVTGTALIAFNALAINIKYKDSDKAVVRFMAYTTLFIWFAVEFAYDYGANVGIMKECRALLYVGLVCASMIVDVFDFPDKYINAHPLCEAIVIFLDH